MAIIHEKKKRTSLTSLPEGAGQEDGKSDNSSLEEDEDDFLGAIDDKIPVDEDDDDDDEAMEKELDASRSRIITPKDLIKKTRRKLSSSRHRSSSGGGRESLTSAFQNLMTSSNGAQSVRSDESTTDNGGYGTTSSETTGGGALKVLGQQLQKEKGPLTSTQNRERLDLSEHGGSLGQQSEAYLASTSLQQNLQSIAIMGLCPVKDRRYRFRLYKQSFVGSQLIDILVENDCARTRSDALELALKLNDRFQLFQHVCGNHELKVSDLL